MSADYTGVAKYGGCLLSPTQIHGRKDSWKGNVYCNDEQNMRNGNSQKHNNIEQGFKI